MARVSSVPYHEKVQLIEADPDHEKILDKIIKSVANEIGYRGDVSSFSNMVQEAKNDSGIECAVDLLLELINEDLIEAIYKHNDDVAPPASSNS